MTPPRSTPAKSTEAPSGGASTEKVTESRRSVPPTGAPVEFAPVARLDNIIVPHARGYGGIPRRPGPHGRVRGSCEVGRSRGDAPREDEAEGREHKELHDGYRRRSSHTSRSKFRLLRADEHASDTPLGRALQCDLKVLIVRTSGRATRMRRAGTPVRAGVSRPHAAQTVRGGLSRRPEKTPPTCSSPAIAIAAADRGGASISGVALTWTA